MQFACSSDSVSSVTAIASGSKQCPAGGIDVRNGDSHQIICNQGGQLVATLTLPVGDANCSAGGTEIELGLDDGSNGGTAGDGTLQPGEVSSTQYICASGPLLTAQVPLPVGDANCAAGGTEIELGLDDGSNGGTAGDGTLQTGEITSTQYLCASGAVLTAQATLPVGNASCPGGGTEIDVGFDNGVGGGIAGDGVLQSGEVTSRSPVCADVGARVGTFLPPEGTAGLFSANLTGGSSSAGQGGAGGNWNARMLSGSNGGHIKTFTTGTVKTTFTVPDPPAAPADELLLSSDTTITSEADTSGAGLTAGAFFLSETGSSWFLYHWDGTTAVRVNDLAIAEGTTVTFSPPTGQLAVQVRLLGELRNRGTLTTSTLADGLSKAALVLRPEAYWGAPGSAIDLRGADAAAGPGGNGGSLEVVESASGGLEAVLVNQGTFDTSGGRGEQGGTAGHLTLHFDPGLTNTGALTAVGGAGTLDLGGAGGAVTVEDDQGALINSGAIDASGGNGATVGGAGGFIALFPRDFGAVRNSGTLKANGGDASPECTVGCVGGNAGEIDLSNDPDDGSGGADVSSQGDLIAHGGDGAVGNGGKGGVLSLGSAATSVGGIGSASTPVGSLALTGNIDLHGGAGATLGGNAGALNASLDPQGAADGQELAFYGYGAGIDVSGGQGVTQGGMAGTFTESNAVGNSDADLPLLGGSVLNNCPITVKGGDASNGKGGSGGVFNLSTQTDIHFSEPIEWVINDGNLDLSGGAGTTWGGPGGSVILIGRSGVATSGEVVANGGAASASGGMGGGTVFPYFSLLAIISQDGPVISAANFTANGGDALGAGGTGGASLPNIEVEGPSVQNSGNIVANGGNGDLQGGDGARQVSLIATTGTMSQTGTVSAQGGNGTTPGVNGVISVLGQTPQP